MQKELMKPIFWFQDSSQNELLRSLWGTNGTEKK
jgi:hypothetical protein